MSASVKGRIADRMPRQGSAADRLLELRVGIPPGAWMYVLFVLYSKDKKQNQDSQDKEIQIKYREKKKSRRGNGFFCCVLCVVNKDRQNGG